MLPVKRHYTSQDSRHGNTHVYYVNNGDKSVRVCKVAFLRIHAISSSRLTRLLANQVAHGGVPKLDAWGHKEPPNKTSEEDMGFIRQYSPTIKVITPGKTTPMESTSLPNCPSQRCISSIRTRWRLKDGDRPVIGCTESFSMRSLIFHSEGMCRLYLPPSLPPSLPLSLSP